MVPGMHDRYAPLSLLWLCSTLCWMTPLCALPQLKEVVSGSAHIEQEGAHLQITASDKAILNYHSFDIGKEEKVTFLQPNHRSSVLNRVQGVDPSSLMGQLQSNGKVFLINPHGIIVGPNAMFNMGSFIASTLDISNDDFLSDRFEFYLCAGAEDSKILNAGAIHCPEGTVALLAPHIENAGVIAAKAGKVVLAGGEKVTLDFSGDGLLSFAVEGALKHAVITHLGTVDAPGGEVFLKLKLADAAIKQIVNTDGVSEATHLIEEHGVIRLVDKSYIAAKAIHVEADAGGHIVVAGTLDASQPQRGEIGGTIHLLSDHIDLLHAEIDASGASGGGAISIGGGYQGGEGLYTARTNRVDGASIVRANALEEGDGGRVILWSDETTVFNGQIFATGGPHGGNGGFVETSGKLGLSVQTGRVDASTSHGKPGEWWLDPATITIVNLGACPLSSALACSVSGACQVAPTTIASSPAGQNVILCATGLITQNDNVAMINSSAGLIFQTPIGVELNGTITTNNGVLIFNTPTVTLTGDCTLSTYTDFADGAPILFDGTINGDGMGPWSLALEAGISAVTIKGDIGTVNPLGNLNISSSAGIFLQSIGSLSNAGAQDVTLIGNHNAGLGATLLEGQYYHAQSFRIPSDVLLGNTVQMISASNYDININGTIDGDGVDARSLSLTVTSGVGAGQIIVNGAMGTRTPFGPLTITNHEGTTTLRGMGAEIPGVGPLTLDLTNTLFLNGGTYNIYGGPFLFPSPVVLGADTVITSNDTQVQFESTIDNDSMMTPRNLTINAGQGGIALSAIGMNAGPLGALNFYSSPAASITLSGSVYDAASQWFDGNLSINVSSTTMTTHDNHFTVTGFIDAAASSNSLIVNAGAGAIDLRSQIGSSPSIPFGHVTLTGNGGITLNGIGFTLPAGNVNISSTVGIVMEQGLYNALSHTYSGDVVLAEDTVVTSGSGQSVQFASSVNNNNGGLRDLTINAPMGTVSINGVIGGNSPLDFLSIQADQITLGGIGKDLAGTLTTTAITATGTIDFPGTIYFANGATYTASTLFNITNGNPTNFTSSSGPISFVTGQVNLVNARGSLILTTDNANISIPKVEGLVGTGNILASAGTGTVTIGDAPLYLSSVTIQAGNIAITGPLSADSILLASGGSVYNNAGPQTLTALNSIVIDAQGGSIGALGSPIHLNAPSAFVMAGSTAPAYFTGSAYNNTVYCLPSNPPPFIVFNAIQYACGSVPSSPSTTTQNFLAGTYSNFWNLLSSDFIFLQDRAVSCCGVYTVLIDRVREADSRCIYGHTFERVSQDQVSFGAEDACEGECECVVEGDAWNL